MATIGIDAHKHFAEVAILEPGRPIRRQRIGTTPSELKAFVERLGPQDQVVIPGVGLVTALAIAGVIGDVGRFPRPNQLVGYLGLDPRVRQSGERAARTGHISRQGQGHARGRLIEAAHSAVRAPGPLRAFHERIRSRRGRQIALVAVARKLAVLAWHLLNDDTDYRWASATLTADKLRQVARKAGQPIQRAPRSAAGSQTSRRDQERRLQLQAEEAYRALVAARQAEMNAAASNGERLAGSRPDAPAERSPQAERKAGTQPLPDGTSVHSFSTLLNELATLTKNRLRLGHDEARFDKLAEPTPLQQRAFALLGLRSSL